MNESETPMQLRLDASEAKPARKLKPQQSDALAEKMENSEDAPSCSVKGCPRAAKVRGYCGSHYLRLWKYGDVLADKPLKVNAKLGLLKPIQRVDVDGRICLSIPLTQGFFAIADIEDEPVIAKWNWHVLKLKGTNYAATNCPGRKGHTVLMHRLILGCPDDLLGEHKNHNGLDNRRENIRVSNQSQNLMNKTKRANVTSRYIGVSWCSERNLWAAFITVNGKSKNLGRFKNERTAAIAYDRAAIQRDPTFANPNILRP